MRLEGDAWSAYFRDFQYEAFRLETLAQYLVPQERETFAAFRAGAKPPASTGTNRWELIIKAALGRGAVMRRVHAVTLPLSDYLRFEMTWYYQDNVVGGEDIRILDLGSVEPLELPDFDFWMFDERDVVQMLYEPDGTQIGRELLEDPAIGQYKSWRDLAWEASVPFREFWDARV